MYFFNLIRKNWPLVLFFVVLTLFRLSLITKGHCFDADERRYFYALWFWKYLGHGDFFNGFSCLFEVQGRPGFVLLSIFPAGIQLLLAHFHLINAASLHFFDTVSFFNVVISLINSFLFYRIAQLMVSEEYLALSAAVVYSLLVNTNVYIRHLFPYDEALLFFLLSLYMILKQKKMGMLNTHLCYGCGLLCALGVLVYPGYFAFALIIMLFLIFSERQIKFPASWMGGVLTILAITQIISGFLRKSYIAECRVLSGTITHGSFSEGFLFIWRYLRDVEGLIGLILFSLLALYLIYFWTKDRGLLRHLVLPAALVYSGYALSGVLFFKMVFYGRILHMYFPFLVLAGVGVLGLLAKPNYKKAATIVLLITSFISFIPFAYIYSRLSYPEDIYFQFLSDIPENKILSLQPGEKVDPLVYKNFSAMTLNFRSYFEPKEKSIDPPKPGNMILAVDQLHPLCFPSYTFENYAPLQRRLLSAQKYHMKLYIDPLVQKASRTNDPLGALLSRVVRWQQL